MRQLATTFLVLAGACAATGGSEEDLGVPKGGPHHPPPQEMFGQIRVKQTNLTSDQPGVAANTDPNLVNAWGLAVNPASTAPIFWISDNGTDQASLESADGVPQSLVVSVPNSPSGQVFMADPSFDGDAFILDTEGGQFYGWQKSAGTDAVKRVDDSDEGAVYKGLAVLDDGACVMLLATDFHNGKVTEYGAGYAEVDNPGFVDPSLPAGYAPFNVAVLDHEVYVTYALQDADAHDDVAGPGNGFVDVFAPNGVFERRLISGGALNSPWGLALAPASFGKQAGMLLVGNFGDGAINIYNPETGAWRGQLRNPDATPLLIDGLWSIMPGSKAAGDDDELYFTAGPDGEMHGLFGVLQVK